MRCRWRDDRGSVTAEFAAALPAVIVCLALCFGAVQAAAQQVRLVGEASTAARLLGRGDRPPAPASGASQQVQKEEGTVCVTMTAPSNAIGLGSLGMTATARECALDEELLDGD